MCQSYCFNSSLTVIEKVENKIKFDKGRFPYNFGGNISSIIDVGNFDTHKHFEIIKVIDLSNFCDNK